MKTVWILTRESAQLGRYGKQIIGVFANRKDAIDELESVLTIQGKRWRGIGR